MDSAGEAEGKTRGSSKPGLGLGALRLLLPPFLLPGGGPAFSPYPSASPERQIHRPSLAPATSARHLGTQHAPAWLYITQHGACCYGLGNACAPAGSRSRCFCLLPSARWERAASACELPGRRGSSAVTAGRQSPAAPRAGTGEPTALLCSVLPCGEARALGTGEISSPPCAHGGLHRGASPPQALLSFQSLWFAMH